MERTFGNNISLKQRQTLRLQESFDSVSDCKTRTKKDADQILMGLKKQHDHTGYMKWDMEDCIRDVSQLTDGSHINFSELARIYYVHKDKGEVLKNGGQIVKSIDIDINRFEGKTFPRLKTNKTE